MDRLNKTNSSEGFSRHAEEYDHWFEAPRGRMLFDAEVKAIRLLMKDFERPFLEVGVGTRRFAKELGIDLGIDPSVKMLSIAVTRGIKTIKAEGEALPFLEDSFGAVFLLFAICFVRDPEKVLAEAKRVLKPGGGLIIGFINRKSPWGKLYMEKKTEGHPIYQHAKFYTVDEVAGLLRQVDMGIGASASTLCQHPPQELTEEKAHDKLIEDAGFVCTLARKE